MHTVMPLTLKHHSMEDLLKRREELLRAKQKVERKLKLATKFKSKDALAIINEEEVFTEDFDAVLDMKWDHEAGRLANEDSMNDTWKLPETADKETNLLLENGGIGLSYKEKSYLLWNNEWHKLGHNGSLFGINFHESRKILLLTDKAKLRIISWPGNEVLHEIEEVEKILKSSEQRGKDNTEIFDCRENILMLKYDGSLTICDLVNFDETIYLPHSNLSPKSSFNPKHIVYYNHDTDATLFLVLYDQIIGKMRVIVCGVNEGGSTEMASILIPKDNLWLKVVNPFIIYQDSKRTVHILSLFTLVEDITIDLEHKIQSFAMLNTNNLVFNLINGEFIHFQL